MMLGKLIAGSLGFMAAGPFGAVLGLYVGHQFDRGAGGFARPVSAADQARIRTAFFETVFSLLGHVAKADGRVSTVEVSQAESLMVKMNLDAVARRRAIDLFKKGSGTNFSVDDAMQRFMDVCGRNNNLKQQLLNCLISLAMADGDLHSGEQDVLRKVASHLGFSSALFDQFIQMIKAQSQFGGAGSGAGSQSRPSRNQLADAYQALGVSDKSSMGEVKKAYRKLISQNHPDKLIGQGMPEDMVSLATQKTQEIQGAYDLIVKHLQES